MQPLTKQVVTFGAHRKIDIARGDTRIASFKNEGDADLFIQAASLSTQGEQTADNFELHERATELADGHSSYELAKRVIEAEWERDEARALWNRRTPPKDMTIVPNEITAESGHKAGMIGDFSEEIDEQCPECEGAGWEEDDACELCGGRGQLTRRISVEWSTIKAIHRRIVETATQPSVGNRACDS